MISWIAKPLILLDSGHWDLARETPLEQLHCMEMNVLGRSQSMGFAQ